MKIMHTMASEAIAQRPKRRYYSPVLKSKIVAECRITDTSVAGVAMAHGINANIVHRWLREQTAPCTPAHRNEFVALPLTTPVQPRPAPAFAPPASASPRRVIRVEVQRNAGVVTVDWPLEDAASCVAWLHGWLR